MRIGSAHHHLKSGLTHPNKVVAAATWLLAIAVLLVLVRLVVVLVDDFWVTAITWMQP